jgi:type IV pilus assembly protein PilM
MAAPRVSKPKDHTVLGLDIGTRFIKVVEVRLQKGTISVLNAAMRPTPAGVVSNSQILDSTALGRAIRELLVLNRIACRKVVVSLAGQSSVVVRPIDLPRMSAKELAQTMKFEVERHIPFAADEVVMDYAPLVDPDDLPEESQMKVLLAVAQEELVNNYINTLRVAGLHPVAMDMEILATIRSLVDIKQEDGGYDETVALVDIGACSTDISIVKDGNLTFTRSVPIAGDSLTEAISEQLGRSFDEAEELKKQHGRIFVEEAFVPGATPAPAVDTALSLDAPLLAAEEPAEPAGDAGPDQLTSFFSSFGAAAPTPPAPTPPPAAPAAPAASGDEAPLASMFSLDEDFEVPGPAAVGQPARSEPAAPSPSFQLDDDVDDDVAFPFQLGGETDDAPPAPVLRLDEDEHDPASALGTVFQLDDDVDDEPFDLGSGLSIAPGAAAEPPAPPIIRLDEDGDDPFGFTPTPLVLDEEPAPAPLALDEDPAPMSISLDLGAEPTAAPLDLDAAPAPAPLVLGDEPPAGGSLDLGAVSPAIGGFSLDEEPALTLGGPLSLGDDAEPVIDLGISAPAPEPEPEPLRIEPEPAPAVSAGPVFDLSSELDLQLPTYSRPAADDEDDDDLFTILPPIAADEPPVAPPPPGPVLLDIPATAPGPVTLGGETAFDLSMDLAAPAEPAPLPAPDPLPAVTPPVEPLAAPSLDLDALAPPPAVLPGDDSFGFGAPGSESSQNEVFQRRIFESMVNTLMEMVTEIRRSLEYYTGREPDTPISRIVLYGGTSRIPYLAEFMQVELGIPVEIADPLPALDVDPAQQPSDFLQEIAPALPVCLGLAMRDMIV